MPCVCVPALQRVSANLNRDESAWRPKHRKGSWTMSNDTNRSGQDASGGTEHSEDAVLDALRHILSQSEAARSALATTLREGGTAVGTIAGVLSQAIDAEERASLAGLDEEGVRAGAGSASALGGSEPRPAERVFQGAAAGPAGGAAVRCAGGAAGQAVAGAVPGGLMSSLRSSARRRRGICARRRFRAGSGG